MNLQELLYVGVLVALALAFTEHCGGDVGQIPGTEAAADDAAAPPSFRVCYVPATPLRAYACGAEADCSNCPTSCTAGDAGEGECKP